MSPVVASTDKRRQSLGSVYGLSENPDRQLLPRDSDRQLCDPHPLVVVVVVVVVVVTGILEKMMSCYRLGK